MTPRGSDRRDDDGRGVDVGVGLFGALRHLLDAIAEAGRDETDRGTGRTPEGHFRTEFGFSGQVGGSRSGADRGGTSHAEDAGESYHVDARYDDRDDELLVVADLPDVDANDLVVGLDEASNDLVIGVRGRVAERVSLPWPVDEVASRFNHGVLELRLSPSEREDLEE